MSWHNKVVWTEGMFLRPQHFQQNDRFLTNWIEARSSRLVPFGWGISHIVIDEELLALGKLSITECQGVFPDGTPIDIPAKHIPPAPLDIPADSKETVVSLTLPLKKQSGKEIQSQDENEPLARYHLEELEIRDTHSGLNAETAAIETGKLWTSLQTDEHDLSAFAGIPLARIVERRQDNQLILDSSYIPACLNCSGSKRLIDYIHEVEGLLKHRGDNLAERLGSPGAGGVAEVVDFLLLQIVNRYQPLFVHYSQLRQLHPVSLYQTMVQMVGELATITEVNRRPAELPDYIHDRLTAVFKTLVDHIRQSLNWVPDFRAVSIPLKEHKFGIRSAVLADKKLIKTAEFVLAVNAQVPVEKLHRDFPNQITIANKEKLRDLVMSHITGIEITPLAVAPRQIPYHAGFTYFTLDKHSSIWKELEESGAIAMHFSGDYPELVVEFWAIKD